MRFGFRLVALSPIGIVCVVTFRSWQMGQGYVTMFFLLAGLVLSAVLTVKIWRSMSDEVLKSL